MVSRARRRRAPTAHETGVVLANLHPTAGQCRGDPVGRPMGALHAGQRRRVTWDHRARWHQGDAPRRPYRPRCTATRIAPAAIAGTRRTSCRGARTAHTMPRDVRDANVAMGAYAHAMISGHGAVCRRGGCTSEHGSTPGVSVVWAVGGRGLLCQQVREEMRRTGTFRGCRVCCIRGRCAGLS
jgi:hypothetical protein